MGLFEFSLPPTFSYDPRGGSERSSNLQLTERSCPDLVDRSRRRPHRLSVF
jgi:hypothetical protein